MDKEIIQEIIKYRSENDIHDIAKNFFFEYARYVNVEGGRAVPHYIDGLKTVQRRVLYVLHEIGKTKYVKAATVCGRTIGYYHPHGESSVFSTLVNLVQDGVVEGQGNWGSKVGTEDIPAAAMRYVECKQSDFVEKTCFSLVDYVPHVENSLGNQEPSAIPNPVPLGLVAVNNHRLDPVTGIGVGVRPNLPLFRFQDLVKRASWLNDKDSRRQFIPSPYFGDEVVCTSSKEEILKLFTKGEVALEFLCEPKKVKEEGKDAVLITEFPPGTSFTKVQNALKYELENDIVYWRDSSTDRTKIYFFVNPKKRFAFDKLYKTISNSLKCRITFSCWFTDGKQVILFPLDIILRKCFEYYRDTVFAYLDDKIEKINATVSELNLLYKIRPELKEYMKTGHVNMEEVSNKISKTLSVDANEVLTLLSKYSIKRLLSISTDIDEHMKKLETLKSLRKEEHIDRMYEQNRFILEEE